MAGLWKMQHAVVGTAVAVGLLAAGCTATKSAARSATTAPTTVAPVPSTSVPATTTAPTTPPTTTVVGLVVNGGGTTLTPPAAATVKAYSADCRTLLDSGFYGSCITVTAGSGTIVAIVEQQRQDYQPGQPITSGQELDLVYLRQGSQYALILRRVPVANGEAETRLYASDIMRDGDRKAVFITPAPNASFGNELDVVEASGAVTLFRQLHGGFADVAPSGGLQTYLPDARGGYDATVIAYRQGAWRIISDSLVSQSQAQAENAQPFFDPTGQSA